MYSDELTVMWCEDTDVPEVIYYWDTVNNRWLGKSVGELIINQNTMTTGEQIEKAIKMSENAPYLQSKIDRLANEVDKMKDMSDYV